MDHRGAPGSGNDGCWALPPFHERAPLASPRGLLDGRRLRCLRLKSSSPCHVVGNSAITPIEPAHPQISIARQCDLVGLPRSTYYYQGQGESAENLTLMRLLDKQYTDTPYYGVRRMTAGLRSRGYPVNPKRVARLMHTMGIEALYPKPHLSQTHPAHRVYR